MSPASSEVLAEELTTLPIKAPVLIMPKVSPPVPSPLLTNPNASKGMKKFAAKYDVSKIGERGIGKGMNFYSIDREQEMGNEFSNEIERSTRLVSDPVIGEYVNRLGQNLVRNSDAKVPFTIKVIDSNEVNAFALPGGFFYVNSGLILAAENEAELAGVMSHEIAHVAARHATHNMSKRNLINLCSIPLIFAAGPAGMVMREAAEIGTPLTFMKFSRDAEREADLLGMEYAYASGYDPAAMVSFFERMEAQEKKKKGFVARAFDSHPMTTDRVRRAQEEMSALLPAKAEYMVTTSEFDEVKARLEDLVNHHMVASASENKPTLRRSAGSVPAKGNRSDEDRPTLKRSAGN